MADNERKRRVEQPEWLNEVKEESCQHYWVNSLNSFIVMNSFLRCRLCKNLIWEPKISKLDYFQQQWKEFLWVFCWHYVKRLKDKWKGMKMKILNGQTKSAFVLIVQLLNHVQLFATPWATVCQAYLSFTISQSWLKLRSIELMMPSNRCIPSLSLLLLPSILIHYIS